MLVFGCGDAAMPAGGAGTGEVSQTGPQGSAGTMVEATGTTEVDDPGSTATSDGTQTGTGTDGVDPPLPPEVPNACDAPTVTLGPTLSAATDQWVDGLALAWTGSVGALVYAESTGKSTWDVKLQRLDGSGDTVSTPIALGDATLSEGRLGEVPRPVVSLTSSGATFVACHGGADGGGSIACSVVDEDGAVTPGIATAGRGPAVAAGPAGLGLVYLNGGDYLSQRLGADAAPVGEPHLVLSSTPELDITPRLAATAVDYVAYADVTFPRFDTMFEEREGEAASWLSSLPIVLAGTQDVTAAANGSLEGVLVRVVRPDDEDFSDAVRVDGLDGNTSAATVAITRGADSFAVLWSVDATVEYAAVDLDGASIAPASTVLAGLERSDTLAVTGVADGFLLAAAPGFRPAEINLAHLACP